MKKTVSFLLALVLMVAPMVIPANVAKAQEPKNIILWHSMQDAAGEAFERYVQEFNEGIGAQLQITVESVFQGQYADATTKLRTILQNDQVDQLPDIMQIDATGMTDYMGTEHAFSVDDALALDKEYDISQIAQAPLQAWNYNSRQLGLPFSASTTVMYYNKTMLDSVGVTKAPTTFAEIVELAKLLPENNANGQKLTAYAQLPNTPSLANWIGQIPSEEYQASYVVNHRNGREGSATELVCDKEGTLLTFLESWKNMYDQGAVLNSGDALSELFLTEQIALFTTSSSNTTSLLEQIDGRYELGCAYFPRINEEANFGATISGSGLFMFNRGNDDQAMAAWELMKYLTSAQVQADYSIATGYVPVNKGSYEEESFTSYTAQYPQMLVSTEQIDLTSPDMMGVTVGPSRDFYLEIQQRVSDMLTANTAPDQVVTEMADSLNGMLEQYALSNQ